MIERLNHNNNKRIDDSCMVLKKIRIAKIIDNILYNIIINK